MRIAIVGASKLTENEERDAQQFCGLMMNEWLLEYNDLKIVSGGAEGVDTVAETTAKELGIPVLVLPAHLKSWNGVGGYKNRNLSIVENCDKLFCLPANYRDQMCYHCGTNEHQRSGGCWTAKQARKEGKEVRIIPPTKR